MSNINNETNDHYIYLLQEREFIKTNEPIYKIGKTKKPSLTRLQNYPKGTILIFQIKCKDCDTYEKILISIFKEKFIQHKNIGNEYFMGNYFEMINVIYNLIWERDIKEGIDNTIDNNNDNKCSKCNKNLSSKQNLNKHLLICKGVSNALECHLCHKIFSHRTSKWKHLKTCKNKDITSTNVNELIETNNKNENE